MLKILDSAARFRGQNVDMPAHKTMPVRPGSGGKKRRAQNNESSGETSRQEKMMRSSGRIDLWCKRKISPIFRQIVLMQTKRDVLSRGKKNRMTLESEVCEGAKEESVGHRSHRVSLKDGNDGVDEIQDKAGWYVVTFLMDTNIRERKRETKLLCEKLTAHTSRNVCVEEHALANKRHVFKQTNTWANKIWFDELTKWLGPLYFDEVIMLRTEKRDEAHAGLESTMLPV